MKAKEFVPASKPRNFVAKNQKTAGAGAHKDKKKAEKQGDVKHKAKQYEEDVAEVFGGDKETGVTHKGGVVTKTKQGIKHTKTDYDDGNGEKGAKRKEGGPNSRYYHTSILDKDDEVDEARMSAAVKLQRAWERERAKSDASLARTPSSIPKKEEPKKEEPKKEGWKDEADDFSEWSDYVKERLTKAAPDQRLGLAKKLSQIEVKNFGSSIEGGFNKQTGKPGAGLGLTDTVRSALRYFNSEQDSIRRQSDQDGAPGNFSMPFGSVDIPGMENATPEELAVMKKAVMMGPQVAGAAAKVYKKNGTITSQDLKNIERDFEKASGIEFGKPMYSSPEAKDSRERAMRGESINRKLGPARISKL